MRCTGRPLPRSQAAVSALNPLATKILLPVLFDGMGMKKKWQTKVLSLELLGSLALTATSEVGGGAGARPPRARVSIAIGGA